MKHVQGEEITDKALKDIFDVVRRAAVPHDQFLKTRVIAELNFRQRERGILFWKRLGLASTLASLVLMAALFLRTPSVQVYEATTDKAMVVRVEVNEIDLKQIAQAQIDLPEGVYFYSPTHPEIQNLSRIKVNWGESLNKDQKLSIVIVGKAEGLKDIRVTFFNIESISLGSTDVFIKFSATPGDGA